jgi:hypothetical protein
VLKNSIFYGIIPFSPVDRHTYASKELTASIFSVVDWWIDANVSEDPIISIFRVTTSNISTYITKFHGVTSQKTEIFKVTAMRTPNLTLIMGVFSVKPLK